MSPIDRGQSLADPAALPSYFLAALLIAGGATLYWTVVPAMVSDWWTDPNFSHGFIVPIFSGYIIYCRRRDLEFFPNDSGIAGLAAVAASILMLILGKAGGEYFTMRISLVVFLAGVFMLVAGTAGFRKCLLPIAYLLFMVPIPVILYDTLSFPLRGLASRIGEASLSLAGVPVFREGNLIFLPNLQLEVADACSGIRSLMSLFALAVPMAHFLGLALARGSILVASAVPISIVVNAARIFVTGSLAYRFGQKAAEGFFHEFSGWILFLGGTVIMVASGLLLRGKTSAPALPPAGKSNP